MARTRHPLDSDDAPDPQTVLVQTLATGLVRLMSAHSPICSTLPDSSPASLELPRVPAVSVPDGERPKNADPEVLHDG